MKVVNFFVSDQQPHWLAEIKQSDGGVGICRIVQRKNVFYRTQKTACDRLYSRVTLPFAVYRGCDLLKWEMCVIIRVTLQKER